MHTKFYYSYNNIVKHQLLHVSVLIGPSSGSRKLRQTTVLYNFVLQGDGPIMSETCRSWSFI